MYHVAVLLSLFRNTNGSVSYSSTPESAGSGCGRGGNIEHMYRFSWPTQIKWITLCQRPHFPQSIMQDFNNPSSGTFNGIAKGGGARGGELFPLEKGLPPSPSIAKNYRPKHWDPPLKGPRLNTCEGSFKRTAKVLRNMHVPRALAREGISMHPILNVKLDKNHVKLSSSPYTPFQPGN